MQPELLTRITLEQAAAYVLDGRFWLQQKRDGVRLMVHRKHQQLEGWNKQGQMATVLPGLASALLSIDVDSFVLDGELEGQHYYCWDLLAAGNCALADHPYAERYRILQVFANCPSIRIVPSWTTAEDKERMIIEFHRQRAEGVVFKDSQAPYRPGRAQQHFKLKFDKTATARVREVDPVRDRVSIEMRDGFTWREVCGLKVRNGTVQRGQFVEVKYLYGTPDRRLVQPRFLMVRTDVSDEDCSIDQIIISNKWSPEDEFQVNLGT